MNEFFLEQKFPLYIIYNHKIIFQKCKYIITKNMNIWKYPTQTDEIVLIHNVIGWYTNRKTTYTSIIDNTSKAHNNTLFSFKLLKQWLKLVVDFTLASNQ